MIIKIKEATPSEKLTIISSNSLGALLPYDTIKSRSPNPEKVRLLLLTTSMSENTPEKHNHDNTFSVQLQEPFAGIL